MDVTQLCAALQACLSINQDERKQAEEVLKQHELQPGQVVNLLRVAAEPSVDEAVRQVAAISFKNSVKRSWMATTEGTPGLSELDKDVVRSNLLESLLLAPHSVQVQLGEAFKAVAYCDYPQRWPHLLQGVVANLSQPDEARIHGALYALRILTRKFEFRDEEEDRAHLEALVVGTFPLLLSIFSSLLAHPVLNMRAALLSKLVCKTFWSATFMGIPAVLLQEDQFRGWMRCFHEALTKPVPEDDDARAAQPDRARAPWWKAKKWVMHITYRLFTRYGEPRLAKEGKDHSFAKLYAAHCSQQYLEDTMAMMAAVAEGRYVAPRVVNLALQYIAHAVEVKATYQLMKPHLEPLLLNVVFPLMCFDASDAELWQEDPQEYIRKGYDILEDMYSPKTAAANFAHTLCQKKPKAHLPRFMAHLASVLEAYLTAQAAGNASKDLARQADGALYAVGALCNVLKAKSPYNQNLEGMLNTYIAPAFASPYGHIRAKACWVAGVYSDVAASSAGEGCLPSPVFGGLLHCVIRALGDAELPVRVDAVVALRSFVEELHDLAQLVPILPQLMDSVFALMREVDNEDLVFTLEAIVDKFGEEIGPYAVELASNLTLAFWNYNGSGDDEDEDETSAIAAYGCLKALNTLLDSVSNLRHLYPTLEEICLPIMQAMISGNGQDVAEDVLEMLTYFTFFRDPQPSPALWALWPQVEAFLLDYGMDYWDHVLPPLDNFISRGTDVFLTSTNPNYQESVFKMVKASLVGDYNDNDVVAAPKLLDVVLQNCKGAVDVWVEPYVHLALQKLSSKDCTRPLRDALVVLVANTLVYNAVLALAAIQKAGATTVLFGAWFEMIHARRPKFTEKSMHFRALLDKKVCALALSSILLVPDDALPAEIAAGLPQLLAGTVKVLLDFKAQQAEKEEDAKANEGAEDDDGDEDEDAEFDHDDDDDQLHAEEDDAYQKRLQREARQLLNAGGDDDDDDDSEQGWTDDEEELGSPLDTISPYAHFAEVVSHLQTSMPQRYNALIASAEPSMMGMLNNLAQYAAQVRAEEASKQVQAQ